MSNDRNANYKHTVKITSLTYFNLDANQISKFTKSQLIFVGKKIIVLHNYELLYEMTIFILKRLFWKLTHLFAKVTHYIVKVLHLFTKLMRLFVKDLHLFAKLTCLFVNFFFTYDNELNGLS